MKLFKTRFRIVTDQYNGYEAQIKRWWCPVWLQIGVCNTHFSVEDAEKYIIAKNKKFISVVVKEVYL